MSESKIRISFMFLGGFPDLTSDVGRAWKNWIFHAKTHHPSYLKKIMFVTHPMSNSFKLSKGWKKILGSIVFYALTKEKEHLQTAWATRSLVDATILMIRKSFELSKFVQKFILLDTTSCPLYNLKVIYTTVTRNRLNWLDSPLSNTCKDLRTNRYQHHSQPGLQCDDTSDSSICFKDRDCSFWSQWLILDVKYIQDILQSNIIKDEIAINCPDSSAKVNRIVAKQTKNTKKSDKVMNATLGAFVDTFHQKPCVMSDELYFGMFLKKNLSISEFIKIIFVIRLSALTSNYSEIKAAHLTVRKMDAIANPLIGSRTGGSIASVDAAFILRSNTNTYSYMKYQNRGDLETYPFFINAFRLNDRTVRGWYTVPSTYVDWRYSNPDPINIFRSFHYKGYSISDLIDQDPIELITLLKSWNAWNETFKSLHMGNVPWWAHPMQYNSRSAKNFLNAYNMMEYFSKMGTDEELQQFREMYKNILKTYLTSKEVGFQTRSEPQERNFILIFYIDKEFQFAAFKKGTAADRQKLGCPITHNVLNEARMRGALFIRKCENGSYIHAFSTQLFGTNSYLYQHLLKKKT